MILSVLAQDGGTAPGPQPPTGEPPWMSQLTDEQKQEIEQLTQSLKDSGATQEEIRDAIDAKLEEWGIEIPETPTREPQWMNQLTDEQKEEIQELTQSLTDSGATRDEIRDAVNAKLQEWGIQMPEPNGGPPTNSTRPSGDPPWMSQLTDEQKTEIQQLIESLRASGATPEEIRDAVNAKLQEWGIELPEMPAPPSTPGQ